MFGLDIYYLDLISTAIFAFCGAAIARERGSFFLFVCLSGVLTAIGGGTLRHCILQADSMFWMEDYRYILVCTAGIAAAIRPGVCYALKSLNNRSVESLCMAVFIAIGYSVTMAATDTLAVAMLLGIVTGIGGGLIRDTLAGTMPGILLDPLTPVLILASYVGIFAALALDYEIWIGSCLGVASIETCRLIASRLEQNGLTQICLTQTPRVHKII